jgi:subtilisin family serine protease
MGIGSLTDIDCGVKRAVDLGAKVLNRSFGVPEGSLGEDDPVPHVDVIQYALARGCVLVAASGNSGETERFIPAAAPGVIAVGAVDDDAAPTAFTTRGDHVAVAAPGLRVVTATREGQARVTGTSFAAPFVTAAAALVVSRALRRAVPLTSPDVRRLLQASASPFAGSGSTDGCGAGVLDILATLQALDRSLDEAEGRAPPEWAPTDNHQPITRS